MSSPTTQVIAQVRKAGYEVLRVEQPRPNRWVMVLRTPEGCDALALVQRRPLIGAADVHDLAETLRLRRVALGYLLALDGRFTAEAHHAAQEQRHARILLCTALPSAGASSGVTALEPARGRG